MSRESRQLLLSSFFSAYFHEDWRCDADSTEAVVTEYARTATLEDMHSLGEAILDFSREFVSEEQLEEELYRTLGCYYQPSAVGLSAKAWLAGVARQLLGGIE
jgi:hypothetical protein